MQVFKTATGEVAGEYKNIRQALLSLNLLKEGQSINSEKAYGRLKANGYDIVKEGIPKPTIVKYETATVKSETHETKTETAAKPQTVMNEAKQIPLYNQQDPTAASNKLVEGLTALIQQSMQNSVNEDRVKQIVSEAIKGLPAREIEIKLPEAEPKRMSRQHCKFETLLKVSALRKATWLTGPAGSGKTTAAEKVAEALELDFYSQSVSAQTTKSDMMGFIDANGVYRPSLMRKAFENGGVFLLDEVDNGNPNVLASLNNALANGQAAFPDAIVEKHPDFICIAAANTFGTGADRQYVGRQQIDAATLDRFAFIDWPYDEDFERELAANKDWCRKVQKIRKAVGDLNMRVIVSPRATIDGEKLLKIGMNEAEVMNMLIFKGMKEQDKTQVLSKVS